MSDFAGADLATGAIAPPESPAPKKELNPRILCIPLVVLSAVYIIYLIVKKSNEKTKQDKIIKEGLELRREIEKHNRKDLIKRYEKLLGQIDKNLEQLRAHCFANTLNANNSLDAANKTRDQIREMNFPGLKSKILNQQIFTYDKYLNQERECQHLINYLERQKFLIKEKMKTL